MFDQEAAIDAWRARLVRTGYFLETDLDELEEHVRDHLDALAEVDLKGEAAFRIAMESLGEAGALGDEFAKVNRLLAWREPLFWIASGAFAIVLGMPCLRAWSAVAYHACVAVDLPPIVIRALMWPATFFVPIVLFAVLFRSASNVLGVGSVGTSHTSTPPSSSWVESPLRRVGALLGCGLLALGAMVGSYILSWDYSTHNPALDAAQNARWAAYSTLSEIAPFAVGAFALGLRLRMHLLREGKQNNDVEPRDARDARDASTFWLALGCLVAFAGSRLADIARFASWAGGGAVHFEASSMRVLVWIVALTTPAVILTSGMAWLRHRRSPSPREFLDGRGAIITTLACIAIPFVSPLIYSPLAVRAVRTLGEGVLRESARASVQTSLVVMPFLVVVIGALVLRFRTTRTMSSNVRRAS